MFRHSFLAIALTLCAVSIASAADPAPNAPANVAPPAGLANTAKGDKQPEQVDNKILKPGVIASSGHQARASSVDAVATSAAGEQESAAPIGASIAHAKEGSCDVRISNSDKKNGYSISFEVQSLGKDGKTQSRSSYSASIKGGESISKRVACATDANMAVVLKSGRKLGS